MEVVWGALLGEAPGRGTAPPGYAIVPDSLQVSARCALGPPEVGAGPLFTAAPPVPAPTSAPLVLEGMGEMGKMGKMGKLGGKYTRWQNLTPSEAKMRGMINMEGGSLSPQQVELVRQLVGKGVPANEIKDILAKDELRYLADEQQEIIPFQTRGVTTMGAVRRAPIYSSQNGADVLRLAYDYDMAPRQRAEAMSQDAVRDYLDATVSKAAEMAAMAYLSKW